MAANFNFPRIAFGPLLAATVLAASVLVAVLGVRSVAEGRAAAARFAEIQSQNLAQAIDHKISGTISRIDHALSFVADTRTRDLRAGKREMARVAAVAALAEQGLPEVVAIRIVDAKGVMVLGGSADDPNTGFGDRPYFTHLRDHPGAGLYISKPFIGRYVKDWIIVFARRIDLPDGGFGGVVVAPVRVVRFEQDLAGFDVGPRGRLTLRDEEGGFLARQAPPSPEPILPIGDRTISKELRAILDAGLARKTYYTITPFDGVHRVFTFRRIQGAPFVVLAGLAEENYLGRWRKDRTTTFLLVGTFIAAAWILAGLLWSLWIAHQRNLRVLLESEAKYRSLVETAQELVWKCDSEGRFTYLNPAWEKTHGYQVAEMLGRSFGDFQTPEVFARDSAAFARQMQGEGVREYETTHLARDGRELTLLFNAIPLRDAEGRIIGCQGTAVDLTGRKLAEQEQERLRAQLSQSQKLEGLGSLAGGVAHDMNNVLGAIMGLASLHVNTQPPGSPAQQAFQTILKAAERGGKMVKSLLGFARQTPAELHELNLNHLVQEQVQLLERTTLAKVALRMELEPDLQTMQGDPSALSHAIMNLCVNAVDAMSEQGTLTLRTRNAGPGEIELQVGDTGTGMSKEVLERALDPFFTTKPQGKGTGLGLSMVHGTVKAHGGRMELLSDPGLGTTVRLRFPTGPAGGRGAEPGVEGPAGAAARALMVLLVDDDELVQSSLKALVQTLGHGTAQAFRGEDALVRVEDGLEPDVVILDMNMPGLGGQATFARLRALRPTLPILLSTGKVDEAALRLVAGDAFTTLLPKPFTLKELSQKLDQAAGRTA
ncbi:MAG TPA: ATP-binding protein [Holophagaceae bacterium]|nr:ATP-binding protein [Holophagaceae bacterium]